MVCLIHKLNSAPVWPGFGAASIRYICMGVPPTISTMLDALELASETSSQSPYHAREPTIAVCEK